MIHICNWLLTRKCNLNCSYCGITINKNDKPKSYHDIKYYHQNEMSTEFIKNILKQLKLHNENIFNIFYGGEPFLRKDLSEIINFCNKENIHYTIISNNTNEIKHHIKNDFLEKVDEIKGFTASVDPIIYDPNITDDIKEKSLAGYNNLIEMKKYCNDVVAEVTVMNSNKKYLYELISNLHDNGINSDITFVDIAKSPFYDFSNVYDENILVNRDKELENTFNKIVNNNLNVHMADELFPEILNSLPSNFDCGLDKKLHNITIDSDGSLRLCLRVKGNLNISAEELFLNDGTDILPSIKTYISWNKFEYCKLCNWTCVMMSKLLEEKVDYKKLIHFDKREVKKINV